PETGTPRSVADQLKRLFATLVAQIDGGHHTSATRTCDKNSQYTLRLAPADPDALQTKLFLLLTTDRVGDLQYAFERAYALYCLQKKDESRAALAQGGEGIDERGTPHLEAQLVCPVIQSSPLFLTFTSNGAYQSAFDIYSELLDSTPTAEEQAVIQTNIDAASAHLDFINSTFLHALDALPSTQLEDAPPLSSASVFVHAPAAVPTPAMVKATEKKKPRLPRGVVLGITPLPDPERWLKKSERASFGQRRRKGGAGGGGGATQGSAADGPAAVESRGNAAESGKGKGSGKKRK
ncbi:hypothetical protein B0H17DRAFT_887045, partial [Mycena rosella]